MIGTEIGDSAFTSLITANEIVLVADKLKKGFVFIATSFAVFQNGDLIIAQLILRNIVRSAIRYSAITANCTLIPNRFLDGSEFVISSSRNNNYIRNIIGCGCSTIVIGNPILS